jgi:hypothetical protein
MIQEHRMAAKAKHAQWTLEVFLIVIVVALVCLLHRTAGYKMIVLNLFYLPVVLTAFFLGRYRAGMLALLSVIAASVVCVTDLQGFGNYTSPIVVGLSVTVWGAVLGLTAILVGTLSDERSAKIVELHEAYVGVVEVLARYLQSANPKLKDRSVRVSELSDAVAQQMRLSADEIDDIRVAALLQDIENIEITARVIRKAVDNLGDDQAHTAHHTFHGTDLVHSLGTVLTGAFPLIVCGNRPELSDVASEATTSSDIPLGGRIIHTVRAYDSLVDGAFSESEFSAQEALGELRRDAAANHHPAVLHALECVVTEGAAGDAAVKTAKKTGTPVAVGV